MTQTIYDAIGATEDATWTRPEAEAAPSHAMTFIAPDGTELVCLDVPGSLPTPRVGEEIGLHDRDVTVTHVSTRYGRDEKTGRVEVLTIVLVTADPWPSTY
ncbi:hypothetical protein AB0G71_15515 [Streptomyces sp. NPDC020403]|uniref:hypothetical protein n=1 Tax=unclassified Streptomyces TaxID=2593676 RepID=UPI0033EA54F6